MKSILKYIKILYRRILQSIAFYPVVIGFAFFLFALVGIAFESFSPVLKIKEKVPYLFIQDYETARSILSTLIAGIMSLTVFSFSMVMVVLSQASSEFSPRLLPGLISNKKHQIILGIYVGTLLYCIIILISLGATGIDSNSMSLSTMLAAIFGVVCIGMFVYFIHNISGAIQIHNIIERTFHKSDAFCEKELGAETTSNINLNYLNTEDWDVIACPKTGYFKLFDASLLNKNIKQSNNQIALVPYSNQHVWKGSPILKVQNTLPKEDRANLIFCLNISSDRHQSDDGIGGLIKLMEIAVKAMSPGINDPGTAIDAISKLGTLLSKFLQFPTLVSKPIKNGNCIIIQKNIPANELMRILVQPIRLYSKHDISVLHELIQALKYITNSHNVSKENKKVVENEIMAIKQDIKNHISNDFDKERVLALINE